VADPRLVLASGSPRRAELLARLGVHPEIRPVDIDERSRAGESAPDLVARLAGAKAAAGAEAGAGDEVVLAADTVVVLDGQPLGKPVDRADARTMLERLAGRSHEVLTGLAIQRGDVAAGEPDDKAGGYGLQGAGAALVSRVEGSDTNVIGLPLAETVQLLRDVGLDLLRPGSSA
jgi:septum formation protein